MTNSSDTIGNRTHQSLLPPHSHTMSCSNTFPTVPYIMPTQCRDSDKTCSCAYLPHISPPEFPALHSSVPNNVCQSKLFAHRTTVTYMISSEMGATSERTVYFVQLHTETLTSFHCQSTIHKASSCKAASAHVLYTAVTTV